MGQDGNVVLLKQRIKNGSAFDKSYLFSGGFGRGKTTLSRIHARAMLCLDLDKSDPEPCNKCDNCLAILNEQPGAFSERDAASHGSVDHARAIVEELPYVLPNAPKRIYLIDECHRMSNAAQDVLLKPIEDKRMVAMFCTTEADKVRGAIRSRCEEYVIRKVTREDILKRMQMILAKENVEYQDDAVLIVIDHAGGHVRDVINTLEMIAQLGPVTVENVREYLHLSVVTLYYQILLNLDNPMRAIELLEQACDQTGPEDVAAGLAEAAMNSYRLAHRMFSDFTTIDKTLADQVYAKYQHHVVKFAQWFLATRYASKLSLIRDAVVFSQNPGNLPIDTPVPPVVFGSVTGPAPVAISSGPAAAPVKASGSEPPAAPAATAAPKGPQMVSPYQDPTPPTEIEAALVNSSLPRQRSTPEPTAPKKNGHGRQRDLTPLQWRTEFDRLLRKKLGSALPK